MKFFICGCNGMAGHTISLYLKEQGHDVYGFDLRESPYIPSFAGNAFDTDNIAKVIKDGNYDTVINCIGVLNQFAENNHALAAFLNSYFPHFLAKTTERTVCSPERRVAILNMICVTARPSMTAARHWVNLMMTRTFP